MGAQTVDVQEGGIRLGQFLKLAGIADSGAQARALLTDGEVSVNGEVEQRRGRQLTSGDEVVVALPAGEHRYRVG
ncbi:MAG TPA: RNA-binding S4 domain-containing protein [Actinotalea sp.]|jgi:ribosome-associated protein